MNTSTATGFGADPSWERRVDAVDPTGILEGNWRVAIAWVGIIGGLLGCLNLLMPSVLRPGVPTLVYVVSLAVLSLFGVGLLLKREWTSMWVTGMVIAGNVTVGAATWSAVNPMRFSNPLMLIFPVLFTATLLGRRVFVVQCLLVFPVLAMVPASYYGSTLEWLAQIGWNAFALLLTGVATRAIRLRAQRTLSDSVRMSNTDPLTGLANRRFVDAAAAAFTASAIRTDKAVAAIVLDLDHFKQINDRYGHLTGDRVLIAVSDAVRTVLRVNDVAARTGGEEVLILAWVDHLTDAEAIAARLHETVGAVVVDVDDGQVSPSCSIGVAVQRPTELDGSQWLWRLVGEADRLLYRAKRLGRNRWVSYGKELPHQPGRAGSPTRGSGADARAGVEFRDAHPSAADRGQTHPPWG